MRRRKSSLLLFSEVDANFKIKEAPMMQAAMLSVPMTALIPGLRLLITLVVGSAFLALAEAIAEAARARRGST